MFSGLLLGCAVTVLVFFDRYPPHNYYQLPLVFPIAFFGAQGLQGLRVVARARRRGPRALRWAAVAVVPIAIVATALSSWTGFHTLASSNRAVEVIRSRGEWIREQTRPEDYVIYIFDGSTDDWNPAYLYFARRADIEGYPDIGGLFRDTSEAETGHAFGHLDFLREVGDPATGLPIGDTDRNLKAAVAGETYEYTEMYPGFAKSARDEGFSEIAEWFETLARAEKSHAGRFQKGLDGLS